MKYVVAWTFRNTGSAAENEAAVRRGLEVFAKWTPPASSTIHQMVGRIDGGGGFVIVASDNPADLADGPSKFGFLCDYQIYPVLDLADSMRALEEGAAFRESIG
jgi:uncharacterized protein DUF3303